jgi:hypothetical protein
MHNLFANSYYHQIDVIYVCHYFINSGTYLQLPFFFQGGIHCKRIRFFSILEYLFVTKLINFLLVSK